MEANGKKCGCPCHSMIGIFVVLFGLVFLLGHLGVISQNLVDLLWPILIILAGLKKVFGHKCKCCNDRKD